MNRQIQELMDESMDYYSNGYVDYPVLNPEKFAQLILEKCVIICNKVYFDRYPDAEDYERSEEGDAIKQHFGVKL